MSEHLDVVIVGGGPAGNAAAIALARAGRSVVVLERSRYDRSRVGETLPPGIRSPMTQLGLLERFTADGHALSAGNLAAWGQRELSETHAITNPYGHGWHIDRRRFELMLASAAEQSGARICLGARAVTWAPDARGEWQVALETAGRKGTVAASYLVDATGRKALVARRLGARRMALDRLISLTGFLSAPKCACTPDTRTLVEAVAEGWWYSAWLPDARLVVAYMSDADLIPKGRTQARAFWQERLAQTTHTRERAEHCCLESVLTVDAASGRLDPPCGRSWLAIGDAAICLDPLSSRGIGNALESGLRAAKVIDRELAGEGDGSGAYTLWLDHTFDDFMRMRAVYYRQEQRWSESLFWRRRQAPREIEKRTKLDFGDTIRAADTISAAAQPLVGAEALRPIRAFSDLLN